jgi:threonine synthase
MTSVTYSSTRGGQKNLDFRTVVMQGLAHDRGLFVPDTIPEVTPEELEEWRSLPFADLAVNVIAKFVQEDQVPLTELTDIIKRSCAAFRSHEVTPLVNVGGHAILVRNCRFDVSNLLVVGVLSRLTIFSLFLHNNRNSSTAPRLPLRM